MRWLGGGRWGAALAAAGIPAVSQQRRAAVAKRRAHVRRLWLQGCSAPTIAARLNCKIATVYGDLATIRSQRPAPPANRHSRPDRLASEDCAFMPQAGAPTPTPIGSRVGVEGTP